MKFKEWIKEPISVNNIICDCTDPSGFDADNTIYPLGCARRFREFANKNNTDIFTNHPEVNSELLFYCFRSNTDGQRKIAMNKCQLLNKIPIKSRSDYKNILDKRYQMKGYGGDDYFKNLGKYKFVISPTGNGQDCYRNYETWISKGIPIVEHNEFLAKKYKDLPILWTYDYSEINNDYLNDQYEKFLNKDFDFRRVLLGHYTPKIQRQILTISGLPAPVHPTGLRTKQFWKYSDYFKD